MSIRFCVLGSGSSGNAALFQTPSATILIDAGFTPPEMERRWTGLGIGWGNLSAVLLTHTHNDHLKLTCLREMARHHVPLYCHAAHLAQLDSGRHMQRLKDAGLARVYAENAAVELPGAVRCLALALSHDRPPTCGFRLEACAADGQPRSVAYLADLGHWTEALTAQVAGVDLLALEFNHDEELERLSGRPYRLIERVLGPHGHLSNAQAAAALHDLLRAGRTRRLVQLHLSRDCNDPELAGEAARQAALRARALLDVHTATQEHRTPVFSVGE